MSRGALRRYFDGIAFKRLVAVDTVQGGSRQHEVGGRNSFNRLLGTGANRSRKDGNGIPVRYVYVTDDPEETLRVEGDVSWYDARHRDPKRGPEWRLYYPGNDVTRRMAEGDLFLVARKPDGSLLIVVAPAGSSVERQLQWLFGFDAQAAIGTLLGGEIGGADLDFQSRSLLEDLEIEVAPDATGFLEEMLRRFGPEFPPTAAFSAFAREILPEVDPVADPDGALLAWFEQEDLLFRELEEHIVARRIEAGFQLNGQTDVAGFVRYSLSVNNRRKSRAGYAFAHHVAEVFSRCGLRFEAEVVTEQKKRLDFMLPNGTAYHDPSFPRDLLTALGVKTTCKDRWRQVLSEAARLPHKHLLTLETRISAAQLDEMTAAQLRLVIPLARHWDFGAMPSAAQPMSVAAFVAEARARQVRAEGDQRRRSLGAVPT